MNVNELKDVVGLVTALGLLGGAVIGIFKYFNYRTHKDRMDAVGTRFSSVVDGIGSKDEVKRRAAAIMLRRFFDPDTEFGLENSVVARIKHWFVGLLWRIRNPGVAPKVQVLPYAKEAANVIAAILREEPTSSFQKLLADGLSYARSLRYADLQKTNLQNAYLGARGKHKVDLSNADFYRADLSAASFKQALAPGATFYQARLAHTVFKGADLTGANFFEADLQGAQFANATLDGADFRGARNIPAEIAAHLDAQGRWVAQPPDAPAAASRDAPLRVFLSRPALMRAQAMAAVELTKQQLSKIGKIEFIELARSDYPAFGALAEVRRLMSGCAGAVVLGVGELEIGEATWRGGTADERKLQDTSLPSPWTQIEAGMAIGLNLPVLLLATTALDAGIFASDVDGHFVFRLDSVNDLGTEPARRTIDDWYATARERASP